MSSKENWLLAALDLARQHARRAANETKYDRDHIELAEIESEMYSPDNLAWALHGLNPGIGLPLPAVDDEAVEFCRETYRAELQRTVQRFCNPGPIVALHEWRFLDKPQATVREYQEAIFEVEGWRYLDLHEAKHEATDIFIQDGWTGEWYVDRGAPHLRAAALLSWRLQQPCAPSTCVFHGLDELAAAMRAAAANNAQESDAPPGRWGELHRKGCIAALLWRTRSGRMRIEVDTNKLVCGLYSPEHTGGEGPYLIVRVAGRVQTFLAPGIRDLVADGPHRLRHVLSHLGPAIGVGQIVDGVADESDREWLRGALLYLVRSEQRLAAESLKTQDARPRETGHRPQVPIAWSMGSVLLCAAHGSPDLGSPIYAGDTWSAPEVPECAECGSVFYELGFAGPG